jgi:hypothetical protein
MKFNVVIATQYYENYGAHDWDGKGQCPQYWKPKGGSEYRHPRVLELNEADDKALVAGLVKEATDKVAHSTDYSQEYVLDWYLLPVGEHTNEEKDQLGWYDGVVKYPSKTIVL